MIRLLFVITICLVFVAGGCSDGRPVRAAIAGQVLIDGEPLRYGYIRFYPSGARASGSQLDGEGRFSLSCFGSNDGAVLGEHRITVDACEKISRTKLKWHAPKKYVDVTASGLTQKISGPNSSLVIELTWAGGKPFTESMEAESAL